MNIEENRRNLRNAQQLLRRHIDSAQACLEAYDTKPTGTFYDLIQYEAFAESAQYAALQVSQCEAMDRVLGGQNVAH